MGTVRVVWLSGDATVIVARVTYDPATNQLVGLLQPKDKNGCPIPLSFEAKDAETIKNHLNAERSTTVYIVMAQPLDEKIPPFVLQMFGSRNNFDAQDVVKRWKYTELELKK